MDTILSSDLQQEFLQYDGDCLVLRLSSSADGKGKVVKLPQKCPSKSFFPSSMVNILQEKMELICRLHQDRDLSHHQSQFVLISETFLQMYNTVFRRLHSFIMSDERSKWIKRTHHQVPFVDEEFTDFEVRTLLHI